MNWLWEKSVSVNPISRQSFQGFVLSCLPFTIYINDVSQISGDGKISIFADDTVCAVERITNSPEGYVRLQDDIQAVNSCLIYVQLDQAICA